MKIQKQILTVIFLIACTTIFAAPFELEGGGVVIRFDIFEGALKNRIMLPKGYMGDVHLAGMSDEAEPEIAVHLTGLGLAGHIGSTISGSNPGIKLQYKSHRSEVINGGMRYIITLMSPDESLKAESYYEFYEGASTVRRWSAITNMSKKPMGVEFLSSALLNNIGVLGNVPLNDKLTFFWSDCGHHAEGRWSALSPLQMGYNNRRGAASITNTGNWSAHKHLPMSVVHDKELGVSWFWQIEHSGSWYWDFSDVNPSSTCMYIGGPDELHHSAWKELAPGEVYTSVPVAIGCVEGSFDEAVAALTRYRRAACISPHSDNVKLPVIFNDYMHCLWADPTTEKEIPLIDAAAKAGCKYFVIDAGWYAEIDDSWWSEVGEWMPSKTRWQPDGLTGVLDLIRRKGMIPGLWLEIERVGINSPMASKPDSWFFTRHGKRVIVQESYQLDFSNPEVRKFADEVIDRVVGKYKVGYLKIDYNINPGIGTERGGVSAGQGLLRHGRAYLEWVKDIYRRYPELVIENCDSGGLQMDYAMLSLNQIQSSSDQTDYRKYPAIVAGTMAAALPEQLAIWSYPLSAATADEAAFNMVSAMLCRIHLSGQLASLPEDNLKQVHQGIEVYKESIVPHIPKSVPFYPLGLPQIKDNISPVALGIRDGKTEFIAVWRLSGSETAEIQTGGGDAELLYPTNLGVKLFRGQGGFSIQFPRPYMACIVKITRKSN